MIAASNLLSFVGIFVAAGGNYLLSGPLGLQPPTIFLWSSLLTLAPPSTSSRSCPTRCCASCSGSRRIPSTASASMGGTTSPRKAGALFVCNHLSFVDALLLIASTDRLVRFIMFKDIYEQPLVNPFARMMGAIPISSKQRPRDMIQLAADSERGDPGRRGGVHLRRGQITRTGQMLPVPPRLRADHEGRGRADRPGLPRRRLGQHLQLRARALPLEAAAADSLSGDRQLRRADAADATPHEVRQAVQELAAEAWAQRKPAHDDADRSFVRTARRHPSALRDGRRPARRSCVSAPRSTRDDLPGARLQPRLGRAGEWSASCCRRRCRARS